MKRHWRFAWITGASHGIGRELALQLADRNCTVACSARSADTLEQMAAERQHILPAPLDVTDASACRDRVEQLENEQGPLDLAILNAGVYDPLPGGIADPAVFRRHMEVNYLGVVNALMALLPRMCERGSGQVAIVASVAGYRGLPQAAAYGPSKAALINLAEILRLELADSGVDIRLVNPGFVSTRLTAKNDFKMPDLLTPDQAAARILRGLQGRAFEIAFPRGFVAWLKTARLLPYAWYLPLMKRITRR